MLLYVRLKNRFKSGAVALFGCIFCVHSYADDHSRVNDFEQFGGDEGDIQKLVILPISMMDDDTLFEAAEAERDASMSLAQRVFNNRWLMQVDKRQSGGQVLRRYLHELVFNYVHRNQTQKSSKLEVNLQRNYQGEASQFGDISNYRLRVSNDNFRLQFRYQFD